MKANKELQDLVNQLDKEKVKQKTVNKGVQWSFNPPAAPHFGGAYEIMVKATKKPIKNILENADINDEELMTAFVGAESLDSFVVVESSVWTAWWTLCSRLS